MVFCIAEDYNFISTIRQAGAYLQRTGTCFKPNIARDEPIMGHALAKQAQYVQEVVLYSGAHSIHYRHDLAGHLLIHRVSINALLTDKIPRVTKLEILYVPTTQVIKQALGMVTKSADMCTVRHTVNYY